MRHLLFASLLALVSLAAPTNAQNNSQPSILEVALEVNADTGEFSTLIAAVLHTGLQDALDARNHLTVFAPTDAAFADIGLDAESIVELPVADVAAILLYHVARGDRFANSLVNARQVRMLNGGRTYPSTEGGEVYINDAMVLMPNIDCRNGVVHVIDTVLLP